MKTSILLLLILSVVIVATGQTPPKFKSIVKIYVDSLGDEDSSDLIREKIKIRLVKSNRFTIVEDPEHADAILTGVAGVDVGHRGSIYGNNGNISGSEGTTYRGNGALRLVLPGSKETIWAYEYKRGFFRARSASGSVAEKVVNQLLKDAKTEEAPPKAK